MHAQSSSGDVYTGSSVSGVMMHPGGQGWPEPPKVTPAERLQFGELAEVVRLAAQAAVHAQTAYTLACKESQERIRFVNEAEEQQAEVFWRELIQATWQVYENAAQTAREVAEKAIARARAFGGEGMTLAEGLSVGGQGDQSR